MPLRLLVWALVAASAAGARDPKPAGQPVPEPRVECFALRTQAGEPVGKARLLRRDSAQGVQGVQLELDCSFYSTPLRVVQVECSGPERVEVVWREIAPGRGRCLLARSAGGPGAFEVVQWGGREPLRRHVTAEAPISMPLHVLEELRAAGPHATRLSLFDPLVGDVGEVRVSTARLGPLGILRLSQLSRDDGSLVGQYVWLAGSLLAWRWQRGGALALRISSEEHERLTPPAAAVTKPLQAGAPTSE